MSSREFEELERTDFKNTENLSLKGKGGGGSGIVGGKVTLGYLK